MVAAATPTFTRTADPATPVAAASPVTDQPMKVGVLSRDNEPGAQPLVKSAADKAVPRPENGPSVPVVAHGAHIPPPPNSYRKQEILTDKLPPPVRARVEQLGYEIQEKSRGGLTRILLPPKLDAYEILRGLEEEFPRQGFAFNFFYEPYRHVLGNAPIEGRVPVGSSEGCSTERCYGRRVVGWQNQLSACTRGVKVGVIDTGFDATHPTFKLLGERQPKVVMTPRDTANRAPDWHGTGVLSLLAGAPTSSTPGLIPDADFLVADAFFANSRGQPSTDTLHLLEALQRLYEHGAQIINLSLVGPYDDVVHNRIEALSKHGGVVFVAAAGNGGPEAPPGYPAAYPEVIAVTAVDSSAKGYTSANRGSYINVAAPGVRIWTALPDSHEGMLSGTSFAAPFVTAIAAVTYNNSPLRAQIAARRQWLDPKEATLAGFYIDKVADGDSKSQRETFGLGLIKAPPDCMPKDQPQPWAAKVVPRVTAPAAGWLTDVKPASFQ
jgi:subtilisin family serine protease